MAVSSEVTNLQNLREITAGPGVGGGPRLHSVDLLRGLVMAIMALDHTRDYFTYLQFPPEDLSQTYGALFFTRWITHFCAPTFFFLAGTGAYLSRKRGAELSNFLWKRGLWLVFLEITVVGYAWSFVPAPSFAFLVIWALGWSMVFLALLVRLPLKAIAIFSVSLIVLHNAFDTVKPAAFGKLSWLWLLLHNQGFYPISHEIGFFVLYPLVPWIGVMGAGYAFGALLQKPAEQRRKTLLILGASMIVAFIVLRATNIYGNPPSGFGAASPGPFQAQKTTELTVIAFLNVEKYPPSLQYLLMTLGPAIMLLAWFEKVDLKRGIGRFWEKILVFGRVPMFYYILHIFLIHIMAVVVALVVHQPTKSLLNGGIFAGPPLPGYGHGLAFIYAMWLLAVFILYFPCKWYAGLKARRKDWWLSYI